MSKRTFSFRSKNKVQSPTEKSRYMYMAAHKHPSLSPLLLDPRVTSQRHTTLDHRVTVCRLFGVMCVSLCRNSCLIIQQISMYEIYLSWLWMCMSIDSSFCTCVCCHGWKSEWCYWMKMGGWGVGMATRNEGRGPVWGGAQIVSLELSSDEKTCHRGRSELYKEGELGLFPVSTLATHGHRKVRP